MGGHNAASIRSKGRRKAMRMEKELINRAWGNQVKSSQELTKQMVLIIQMNIKLVMANRRQGN